MVGSIRVDQVGPVGRKIQQEVGQPTHHNPGPIRAGLPVGRGCGPAGSAPKWVGGV